MNFDIIRKIEGEKNVEKRKLRIFIVKSYAI